MAQTDKTDKTVKATYWSVTAWKEEIDICRDGSRYPPFVVSVSGQPETCPKTGSLHLQGIIKCNRQVRLSALKSWLPTAHLEPARNVAALKNYVKKEDTRTGEYEVVENDMPRFAPEEIFDMLGQAYRDNREAANAFIKDKVDLNAQYWFLVECIIKEKGKKYVRLFMNPIVKTIFTNTGSVWKAEPLVLQAQPDESEDESAE